MGGGDIPSIKEWYDAHKDTSLNVRDPMKLLLVTVFLYLPNIIWAQHSTNIVGLYSPSKNRSPEGNAHVYILSNHIYVVPYFGGVQVGRWEIGKDSMVTFNPKVYPYPFVFWGRHNKDLGDSVRIYFSDFDNDENFIALGNTGAQPQLQRVFNESPNCVPYPSVYKFTKHTDTIQVATIPYDHGENRVPDIYTFINEEHYNDFIAFHIRRKSDDHPFYAQVKKGELYFNEDDFSVKYPLPQEGEDLAFIQQFSQTIDSDLPDTMFYNPYYKNCDEEVYDTMNYHYDVNKGAFISLHNYEEGEEYTPMDDSYNRCFIIYPFKQLRQFTKVKQRFTIMGKPLFNFSCEGQH